MIIRLLTHSLTQTITHPPTHSGREDYGHYFAAEATAAATRTSNSIFDEDNWNGKVEKYVNAATIAAENDAINYWCDLISSKTKFHSKSLCPLPLWVTKDNFHMYHSALDVISNSLYEVRCTHSFTHSLTHSFTRSLTHSLTHSLTQSLTYSLTHSLTHLLTRTNPFRKRLIKLDIWPRSATAWHRLVLLVTYIMDFQVLQLNYYKKSARICRR